MTPCPALPPADEEIDDGVLSCEEGGWGSDDGGVLPLIPTLPPRPLAKRTTEAKTPPPADEYRVWLEDMSFQVGNAAHEVRNALRYWASLVTPSSDQDAETPASKDLLQRFRKADNTSGKLEATMRALVGRVRNVRQVSKPLDRLLPKASALLAQIQADLAQLGDSSELAVAEQRTTTDRLIVRQATYISVISEAHATGGRPPMRPEGFARDAPLALPAPCVRLDFGHWGSTEENLAAQMEAANAIPYASGAEQVIGLARLVCNTSHQLQNLAVAPRGGEGTPAHDFLKELDKLAGRCENASRAIMVLAHRWHMTQRARPAAKIVERASMLLAATCQGEELLTAAAGTEGGHTVPMEELRSTIHLLRRLALILHGSELPPLLPAAERAAGPEKVDRKVSSGRRVPFETKQEVSPGMSAGKVVCAGCSYAVTGITPLHCCRKCAKRPGEHGPRCQRLLIASS